MKTESKKQKQDSNVNTSRETTEDRNKREIADTKLCMEVEDPAEDDGSSEESSDGSSEDSSEVEDEESEVNNEFISFGARLNQMITLNEFEDAIVLDILKTMEKPTHVIRYSVEIVEISKGKL